MRHRISSWVLALVSAAPLVACGSAGGESSASSLGKMSSTELDPCPTTDAGDADAAAPPVDSGATNPSPSIDFTFVAADSPTVIHASTTTDAFGHITIGNYPTAASAPVVYGALPVGFEDAFSASYCAGIRTKAIAAKGTSALAKFNKQFVRKSGGVPVNIVVSPFVGNAFTSEAASAATKAGAPGSAFTIDNPLSLEDVQFHITFESDAMSNIIGETDALVTEQQGYLAQALGTVLSSGEFATAFSAKDLFCDLSTGKAKIQITVSGSAGGAPYAGQATGTLLQPL